MRAERVAFKAQVQRAIEIEKMEDEDQAQRRDRWMGMVKQRLFRFAKFVTLQRVKRVFVRAIPRLRLLQAQAEKRALLGITAESSLSERDKRIKAAKRIQYAWRQLSRRGSIYLIWRVYKRHIAATLVQRAMRSILAYRRVAAMRRAAFNQDRINYARRIQGMVLRAMGFRQRRTQTKALRDFLAPIGLDPWSSTITNPLMEVVENVKDDYEEAKAIVNIEMSLWQRGLFDKDLREHSRKKALRKLQRSRERVYPGDAVMITDPESPGCGFTGRLLTLTRYEHFPGKYVADVKMDQDGGVLTVPVYRKNGNVYDRINLRKVDSLDWIPRLEALSEVNTIAILSMHVSILSQGVRSQLRHEAQSQRVKKDVHDAAVRIQQGYRMHAARKKVGCS